MGGPHSVNGNKPLPHSGGETVEHSGADTTVRENHSANTEIHVEHGHEEHDRLEHAKHTAHQVKSSFATTEKAVEGLARTPSVVAREAAVVGRVIGPAADVADFTSEQSARLAGATSQLEQYHQLQKTAERASRTQSSVARRINRMLTQGADHTSVQAARHQLQAANDAANRAHRAVQEMKPVADRAKAAIQQIAAEGAQARRATGLVGRALRAVANSGTGQRAMQIARTAAQSRVGSVLHAMAESKAVRVGGKVLIVATAAIDGFAARREDATVLGNAFRMSTQAAGSGAVFLAAGGTSSVTIGSTAISVGGSATTAAVLLPVLVAESFWWDGPHVTGTLQSAFQTGGVAIDYIAGGSERGDRALANLDREMKEGKYGGVIKGANYFGQALSDDGVGGVVSNAVDYWSDVSPSEAWRDVKDVWNWLF